MYYPCSGNKGADQLRGYREADLRLCFRIGKNPVFSRCGSNDVEFSEPFEVTNGVKQALLWHHTVQHDVFCHAHFFPIR